MKKSKLIYILFVIVTFGLICNLTFVKADSGFDSSYDSGGSSYSSSDSDYSWSSSDSSYSGDYDGDGSVGLAVIVIFTVIIILAVALNSKGGKNTSVKVDLTDISEDVIKKYLPDYNKQVFDANAFNLYKEIQEAWMNFDYDKLRSDLTDEIYNQYSMQLDTMKLKGEQNVMSDFECLGVCIKDINVVRGNNISITVNMEVRFYDYITSNGNVVRGNKNRKITNLYEITFIMSNNNKINNCPNCGAKLTDSSSQVCPYCNSTINHIGSKMVMSKKVNKQQW